MVLQFYPLSYPQQSIWYIEKYYQNLSFSNLVMIVRLYENVNFELLTKAINLVLKENDTMRLRISEKRNKPEQYFYDYEEYKFDFMDFNYPNGLQDLESWEMKTTRTPFELTDSNLFYFVLIKISEQEGAFYFKCHHILFDVWGVSLVVKQILENYWKLQTNQTISTGSRPSYIDYILSEQEYLTSEKFFAHKAFWNRKFETLPEPTYIKKRSIGNSKSANRTTFIFSHEITAQINAFCAEQKISVFIFFFSILSIYLAKVTSNNDIVISTPVLNRANAKEKATVGMFVNNVLFRTILHEPLDFLAYIRILSKDWRQILKNQRYPHDLLLKDLRAKNKKLDRLTDISLSYQNARFDAESIKYKTDWSFNGNEISSLMIHINDREGEGRLFIDYAYSVEVFISEDIEQIHNGMTGLIQDVLNNPLKSLSELEILSDQEKEKLLTDFNATQANYPQNKSLSRLFAEQVEKNPDKIALVYQNQELTYRELDQKANSLARLLQAKGVKKDTIVGLMVKRSFEMIIGMLGVLKAGGAYLPLDPGYPEARIVYMLEDSNAKILMTQSGLESGLKFQIDKIYLDDPESYAGDISNPEETGGPHDLAYVIYTSGSTGNPKGVMVEQKGVNNLIHTISNRLNLTPSETVISITTFSFDIFVVETIVALVKGLTVVIANEDEQRIPRLLFDLIDRYKVDILQTTPTRMQSILKETNGREGLANLAKILIGGESFPETLLTQLKQITPAEIYNGYGPTETTVYSIVQNITNADRITIGKPVANTQIYILDQNLGLVPVGTTGEIYISGDGLARGYLNNNELTAKSFIANPYMPGTKMYRTGDLGRWLADGTIEYLGRNDAQVKIRGFRIELGEIENCLLNHEKIRQAAVAVKEDKNGKKYLSAYLVGDQVPVADLRAHISKSLPDYMVPARFTWLHEIPLTPSGKTNRKALPEPDQQLLEEVAAYAAPRNSTEKILTELWAKTLELERVGIDDNLFSLGGDSLTVIEILSGLFSYEWPITAQDFYDYPTIRELSAKIRGLIKAQSDTADEQTVQSKDLTPANGPALRMEPHGLGNVLLTGATGFLGIHILKELLPYISGKIYCLVRGRNPQQRLWQSLDFYFPEEYQNFSGDKLVIVDGDITLEKFGLSEAEYIQLAEDIATVIHTAANVKHYGNYAEFERVNVRGTEEIIAFCLAYNKRLHHISTMSVSGNYLGGQGEKARFTENDLYIGQNYQDNVYVRSKFEAETRIIQAGNSGLRANIFRVGVLTGRYSDGHFQNNISENAFYKRIKSIVKLGVIPSYLLELKIEFSPVDYCAKGIVEMIRTYEATGNVYHMYNYKTISLNNMVRILESMGYVLRILDASLFDQYIKNIAHAGETEILHGLITDLSLNKDLNYNSTIELDCQITIKQLLELGFDWPDIDTEYFKLIFTYMLKTGFLEDIPHAAAQTLDIV